MNALATVQAKKDAILKGAAAYQDDPSSASCAT